MIIFKKFQQIIFFICIKLKIETKIKKGKYVSKIKTVII
jgi:hypothetical protein